MLPSGLFYSLKKERVNEINFIPLPTYSAYIYFILTFGQFLCHVLESKDVKRQNPCFQEVYSRIEGSEITPVIVCEELTPNLAFSQGALVVKNLGWEDALQGGHGNPLQYSCLENPMGRGVWRVTVHGLTKSQTQLRRLRMHIISSDAMGSSVCNLVGLLLTALGLLGLPWWLRW